MNYTRNLCARCNKIMVCARCERVPQHSDMALCYNDGRLHFCTRLCFEIFSQKISREEAARYNDQVRNI